MNVNLPVNVVAALSGVALLLQTGSDISTAISGAAGPIERIGLTTALLFAVKVLWSTAKEDRKQIIAMANKSNEASTRFVEVTTTLMDRLTKFENMSDEIGAALDNLAENVAAAAASNAVFAHINDPKPPRSKAPETVEEKAAHPRTQRKRKPKEPNKTMQMGGFE